jgi:hypothetical protein
MPCRPVPYAEHVAMLAGWNVDSMVFRTRGVARQQKWYALILSILVTSDSQTHRFTSLQVSRDIGQGRGHEKFWKSESTAQIEPHKGYVRKGTIATRSGEPKRCDLHLCGCRG